MNARWWPADAPVRAQRLGELTSRELTALTRFAESVTPDGTDAARLAQFRAALADEAAERRDLIARITANAKAGTAGPR